MAKLVVRISKAKLREIMTSSLPGNGPRKVYNPRRMRWEFEDGTPVEKSPSDPRPSSRRMPFGEYKGELLQDVPTDYLSWVSRECHDNGSGLIQAVNEELKRR